MAIFNSYVSLPEGSCEMNAVWSWDWTSGCMVDRYPLLKIGHKLVTLVSFCVLIYRTSINESSDIFLIFCRLQKRRHLLIYRNASKTPWVRWFSHQQ
jgi:hypothetical protein